MADRKQRRAIILAVYGLIAFGLIWMIYGAVRPEPSCFDNKKNQNETGVDCGGVCGACTVQIDAQPLSIDGSYVIDGADGRVDAVVQISNDNALFGASMVRYTFQLKDEAGSVVGEATGTTFILPAETKYIPEPGIDVSGSVASADFTISRTQWVAFSGYQEPNIVVLNKRYEIKNEETEYARVSGLVRNDSEYDFASIRVNIVMKDDEGTPIALHQTRMDTFDSGMERGFSLPWPHSFPGTVASFDVEVEADVFDVDNFRRQYIGS